MDAEQKTRTVLEKLQRLHDLTKPTWDVPEGTEPFMHFADVMLTTCGKCGERIMPWEVWDVCVAMPPAEDEPADSSNLPGPFYGTLYTVLLPEDDPSEGPETPEQKREAAQVAKREWHDAEARAYALLDLLQVLPEAIRAVRALEQCAEMLTDDFVSRAAEGKVVPLAVLQFIVHSAYHPRRA